MFDLSVSSILAEAYEYLKRRLGFYIALVVVYMLLGVALYLIGDKLGKFGSILVRLVEIYLNAGVLKIIIKDINGEEPELFDMFTAQDVYINFLIAGILYGLAVGFGVLLFIVPGIIFAIMWQFYKFGVVDKELGPVEALRYSGDLTKGYRWTILGIDIVLILVNLAGALALGIGLLFTIPLTMIAEAVMYKRLRDNMEGVPVEDTEPFIV